MFIKKTKSKLESETHIVDKEDPSVLSHVEEMERS